MQELEKILGEIEKQKKRCLNGEYDPAYAAGALDMANAIKDIIRKHLSRENTTEITRCSRDTQGAEHEINLPKEEFEMLRFSDSVTFRCGNEYVSLYMGEDEATREYKIVDDGWIPVEERLPEDGTYLCTLAGELCGIEEPFTGMCGIENGIWDEPDCVIAWHPLPEPYHAERSRE